MESTDCPPRLAVVAAIIDGKGSGAGPLVSAAHLSSKIHDKAGSAAVSTATPAERALALALRGEDQPDGPPADRAIAELLLLADDGPDAARLATGLIRAFLPPDHSAANLAGDERRSAFAELYRRLALHELNSQVRNKAAATLCRLIRR